MSRASPRILLSRAAADSVRRGHPWVWRRAILRGDAGLAEGTEVALVEGDGSPIAHGIYDPESPIAIRVWTVADQPIGDDVLGDRIDRAFAVRLRLFANGETDAYRLLNGEGDRMPGFVLDRYGAVAILRADGAAAESWIARVCSGLELALRAAGVASLAVKGGRRAGDGALTSVFGPPVPSTVRVKEHGVPFIVDLAKGQKTGAFLDQRENRRRVAGMARGRTVLNLFSYAGGFSLHSALGGAVRVTSVDLAAAAHATAQESFALAGNDPASHDFVTADAFAFLATAKAQGRKWDLVISDPPSFAPSERALPRALSAYRALHRACTLVLAPGGTFCASSCSSHVDAVAFASTLDDAALGRNDLRILEMFGPPADHPTLASWPEGRYLKFAVLE